jgi:proteic killer suppression protein
MKVEFKTEALASLYETPLNRLPGKQEFNIKIIKQFKRKVDILVGIANIAGLRDFRSLNFEYLKGELKRQCSIRLNDQYRLIFEQKNEDEIEILLILEISKHYE